MGWFTFHQSYESSQTTTIPHIGNIGRHPPGVLVPSWSGPTFVGCVLTDSSPFFARVLFFKCLAWCSIRDSVYGMLFIVKGLRLSLCDVFWHTPPDNL